MGFLELRQARGDILPYTYKWTCTLYNILFSLPFKLTISQGFFSYAIGNSSLFFLTDAQKSFILCDSLRNSLQLMDV